MSPARCLRAGHRRWACSPDKNPAVGFKRLRRELREGPGLAGGQKGVINEEKRAELQAKYTEFWAYSK